MSDPITLRLLDIYRIGPGPSSSHTVGPMRAARFFREDALAAGIAVHDLCEERGVPVWCGGMLEAGVGRLHNIAVATLPNFTMSNDLSASRRYWTRDIIDPEVELDDDGCVAVPVGPGIGHAVREDLLERYQVARETLRP